jgi:peptidylprolyl isomerase
MAKVEVGSKVKVHYVGKLDDGTQFDSSRERGETLGFEVSSGMMIKGFNDAVIGMEIGQTKSFSVSPDDGYGNRMDEAVTAVAKTQFEQGFDFVEGATVYGQGPDGKPVLAKILENRDAEVLMDFNHPLAGQNLNFEVELVEIEE